MRCLVKKCMCGYWNQWEEVLLLIWIKESKFALARWEVDVAQRFPICPLQSADSSRRTQKTSPKRSPSLPLSTDPRKLYLVKPPAVATGALEWSPAHTQQNPLKLPAVVASTTLKCPELLNSLHSLVLSCQPLPLGQQPKHSAQEKAKLLIRAPSTGRAEPLGSFPAPRQHRAANATSTQKEPHQACRGSSDSKSKVPLVLS